MAVTLNDVKSMGDPLRPYNFDLIIPNIPGGGDGNAMRIHLVNTSIPGFSSEVFSTKHHGFEIKHVGRGTFPRTLPVTYVEDSNLTILNSLRRWHRFQWEPNTGIQVPQALYKTDGFLKLLDSDKSTKATYKLVGMFIQSVPDTAMGQSDSGPVNISVTFSYDDFSVTT